MKTERDLVLEFYNNKGRNIWDLADTPLRHTAKKDITADTLAFFDKQGRVTQFKVLHFLEHLDTISKFFPFIQIADFGLGPVDLDVENILENIHKLKNLRVLKLGRYDQSCKILKISNNLCKLRKLEELEITNFPYLTELPDNLANLENLIKLKLDKLTNLQSLPLNIGQLSSLRILTLKNLAITELPDSIKHLSLLTNLELWQCQAFHEIGNWIGGMISLRSLSISFCKLRKISLEIIKTALVKLSFDANFEIEDLDLDSIVDISSLQTLTISVPFLPRGINKLTNLRSLAVSDLRVDKLPEEICDLKMLRYFRLANSPITRLPECISKLSLLQDLHFDEIDITELPHTITEMPNLKQIIGLNIYNLKIPSPWKRYEDGQVTIAIDDF